MKSNRPIVVLVAACLAVLAWSAVKPYAYDVWVFEIAAGVLGVGVLAAVWRRFPFSTLVCVLVGVHFAILAVAAKYTYAEMPLFTWLKDVLSLSRNHYDRVGHFAQGFVPAMIAREVLLRTTRLERGKMLALLCTSLCLALSAFWELLEWGVVVVFYPDSGAEWLGLQGDIWDPHWDMLMALTGAILALALLSRLHDRSMAALQARSRS